MIGDATPFHPVRMDATLITSISSWLHTRKQQILRPRDMLPTLIGSMKRLRKDSSMAFYPCVVTQPRKDAGTLVAIYVIAVIIIAIIWRPGHSLVDAFVVAIGAAWAVAIPARALRRS